MLGRETAAAPSRRRTHQSDDPKPSPSQPRVIRVSVWLPEPAEEAELIAPRNLASLAQEIEAVGLDAVGVTDHPFPVVRAGEPGHHAWDPFTALAWAAAATDRVRLHTNLVVLPYRNPFLLAKAAATLDHLSEGRLTLGLGVGYLRSEFDALGVDFERREEAMLEGVDALKAAMTGEPLSLESTAWRVDGNSLVPMPSQLPHPPLWRGGNSRAAIAHAAAAFDGWSPVEMAPDRAKRAGTASITVTAGLESRIQHLRQLRAAAGRSESCDVCLVRPQPGWMERPRADVLEELAELEAIGVTWIAVGLAAKTTASYLERLSALAALVR